MKCVKCGMDLEDNAKFCGNCGSVVESVQNDQPVVETSVEPASEPVQNDQPAFSSEVSNIQEERQEIVQEPIPVDTAEFKQQQENGKKSSGAIKYILLIVILLAVAAASVFVYFKFFANKESYEKSINTLEKSMKNLVKQDMNSVTMEAKLELKVKNSISVDLGAALEYENSNDTYKIHGRIDKNPMTDQIDIYAEMDKTAVTVYIPVELFELMGESMEFDNGMGYIKYQMTLDELNIDLDGLNKEVESENIDIDLSEVLSKDSFKYVGQKDGIKKYTLKVDKNYLDNFKDEFNEYDIPVDSLDEIGDMSFDMNFYINKDDMLVGIELDLTKALKTITEDIDKVLISISFNGVNSTKVEVPSAVKSKSFDLNQYMDLQYTTEEINSLTTSTTSKLF